MLLDLLGGPDPLIANHFDNTARWFDRLITAGKKLSVNKLTLTVQALTLLLILREETPSTGSSDVSPLRADVL